MLDYETSLNVLIASLGLAISFAVHHKMWKYCLAGFVFLGIVALLLFLRVFNLVSFDSWITFHFYVISLGCIATIFYTIYMKYNIYKKKCK